MSTPDTQALVLSNSLAFLNDLLPTLEAHGFSLAPLDFTA